MKSIQQLAAQQQGCDAGPVAGPIDYLRGRILQKYRPGARVIGSEALASLTQIKTQALLQIYGPLVKQGTMRAAKAEAGSIHISYSQNGQPVEEWISTTIDTLGQRGAEQRRADARPDELSARAVTRLHRKDSWGSRAPAGKFDKKLVATIVASIRPNPAVSRCGRAISYEYGEDRAEGCDGPAADLARRAAADQRDDQRIVSQEQAVQDHAAAQFDQSFAVWRRM